MGLFDFVKDFGKKIFGDNDDPAQKILESITEANPGVSGLGVNFVDGVVHLTGTASSSEAMEKAVLLAGNVMGVKEVKIDGMQTESAAADVQYYTIEKGDNLSKVAKEFYGNPNDYHKLFEANREVIKDPDLIYPGQKIRVPPKTW